MRQIIHLLMNFHLRINIKSVLSCIMHGIRSYASFFSWLLTKVSPHVDLYLRVPSNNFLHIL